MQAFLHQRLKLQRSQESLWNAGVARLLCSSVETCKPKRTESRGFTYASPEREVEIYL